MCRKKKIKCDVRVLVACDFSRDPLIASIGQNAGVYALPELQNRMYFHPGGEKETTPQRVSDVNFCT